jgi:hypothetical protein
MEVGGYTATLQRARRLVDRGSPHQLPSGTPVPVYPVDMFPGCPDEWNRGAGSFVCPVDADWGLWFDWTKNNELNTAILTSVKGMNPVTGQKIDSLSLAKYVEKCPVHDVDFEGDQRLCPKCGYKWPTQSYVSHPNTLWWDGFRQPDGTVRQFFFSEDEKRDIAGLVLGKENVMPAFGFAFFKTKQERVPPRREETPRGLSKGPYLGWTTEYSYGGGEPVYGSAGLSKGLSADFDEPDELFALGGEESFLPDSSEPKITCSTGPTGQTAGGTKSFRGGPRKRRAGRAATKRLLRSAGPVKEVAVGAGAEIRQDLKADPLSPDGWKDKPEALIRLYFVFEPQFKDIVDKGIHDVDGSPEGFMKDLPTG